MVEELSSDMFEEKVLKTDKPVLIDFFATWCGPCKMASPIFDETAAENAGKAYFYKIDVDKCPDIAQRFSIMAVPTFMSFDNGQLKNQAPGVQQKAQLVAML